MNFRLSYLVLLLTAFWSCSEDIDLTAPYEETMAVYGFLNPNDSLQYVRISKAFLGDGNVYVMAQQQDSVNYGNILDVRMERLFNNVVAETFPLTRVDTIAKDSGTFYYPGQVYYVTNRVIREDGSKYRLVVRNTQTGYEVRATSLIIPDIRVQDPSSSDADFATRLPIVYNFNATANARIHDLEIVFRYREIETSGAVSFHSVVIPFTEELTGANPFGPIQFWYFRPDFFVTLGQEIPVRPGVTRRVDGLPAGLKAVEYRFYSGSDDLYTYYQLTRPSDGIVQERPLFTNVENGVGLFTCRLIHSEYRNLSSLTRAAFDTSAYTRNLNFQF